MHVQIFFTTQKKNIELQKQSQVRIQHGTYANDMILKLTFLRPETIKPGIHRILRVEKAQ